MLFRSGRPAGSKSFMWVYRSGYMYSDEQIVLYEYQRTRNASHPRQFLKDYSGVCVTDGYQVYHTVEKELEDLKIAGCWVHCRRKFDEALKAVPKAAQKESLSYLVIKQIQAVYREEDKLKELKPKDRLRQRQVVIKPLVDALFAYLKSNERKASTAKLKQAVTYALNQEKYLRVFLEDGVDGVPYRPPDWPDANKVLHLQRPIADHWVCSADRLIPIPCSHGTYKKECPIPTL